MLREIAGALATELRSLELRGPRGMEATDSGDVGDVSHPDRLRSALRRALVGGDFRFYGDAVAPWPAAVERGVMRMMGASLGSHRRDRALAVRVSSTAVLLCLFILACVGSFGFVKSRYGYAWLVRSATSCTDHADGPRPAAHGVHDGGRSRRRCHDRDHGIFSRLLSFPLPSGRPAPCRRAAGATATGILAPPLRC